MEVYVAKQIEKLAQMENDVDLLNFQLSNPESPFPAPRSETILIISNRIKLMQDKIKELKEEVELINDKAAPDLLTALQACWASLKTYGEHTIIDNQVENAINKAIEL